MHNKSIEKEIYTKKPLSIETQVSKLQKRGLIIDDTKLAGDYLSNISYYRLRAYTYPFQDNKNIESDHVFLRKDIHFKDIIDLYCFDRRLRSLIFNALEKIEVAFRTKIVQIYSEDTKDSHWYNNRNLFSQNEDKMTYIKLMDSINHEIERSNEDFIKHYKSKYCKPETPPAWMTLEVISFGTLSLLYKQLKKSDNKKIIAKLFGINDVSILENWMHALSNLRNCCAHHSRIWNRRFMVTIKFPYNTDYLFLQKAIIRELRSNKLFATLCCIKYLLDIISPENDFYLNLKTLINKGGRLLRLKDMGFIDNWETLDLWNK